MRYELERSSDSALALANGAPVTIGEAVAVISADLRQAARMDADDISLEIDASSDRLRVRFRAYRHRK